MSPRSVDFDSMSEADVREVIIRPLLEKLGYAHNTINDIKTERRFKYAEKYLGRIKPGKGISVEGIADYERIAGPFGKFIVEAKAPSESLDEKVVLQTHSYAAHPEVNARHFLVSNGRSFALYATSDLREPVLSWAYHDEDSVFAELQNYLAPDAIKRRMNLDRFEPGRPLVLGLGPSAKIVGGHVVYSNYHSNDAILNGFLGTLSGRQEGITGEKVERAVDGTIVAYVKVATPISEMVGAAGARPDYLLPFSTASEFISTDKLAPSIFVGRDVNTEHSEIDISQLTGRPSAKLSLDMRFTAVTEAIGYVENRRFSGTFDVEWQYELSEPLVRTFRNLTRLTLRRDLVLKSSGTFQLVLE